MHVCSVLLQDSGNQYAIRILTSLMGPVRIWHGLQARQNRNPDSNATFFSDGARGEFSASLNEVLACFGDGRDLRHMGFTTSISKSACSAFDAQHPQLSDECGKADLMWRFAVNLLRHRLRGQSWLFVGRPGLTALFASADEETRQLGITKLQAAWAAYQAACDLPFKGPVLQNVLDKSPLTFPLMRLVVALAMEASWQTCSPKLRDVAAACWHGLLVTRPVEDTFHVLGAVEQRGQANNDVSPHEAVAGCDQGGHLG